MPRNQTARKQAEKFVSKVSDKMVEDRLADLYPGKFLQKMFAARPAYKSRLLAYILVVMELEEINREIEAIRDKHGVEASLVNIGPRGGRTLTPLQRLRRAKENQVLRKYRSIRQSPEWIMFRGIEGKPSLLSAMSRKERYPRGDPSPSLSYRTSRTEKKSKKAKKSPSQPVSGRRPRKRERSEFVESAEPGTIESGSPHDAASAPDKSQKAPPITEAVLARSIREFEKTPPRKQLLPHEAMTFRAMLVVLKSREEEWKVMGGFEFNLNMRLKATEQITRLVEAIKFLWR